MIRISPILFAIMVFVHSLHATDPLELALITANSTIFGISHQQPPCPSPRQRKEWRALTRREQSDYINAVRCIQTRRAISPVIKEARTRFDEFQALHIEAADTVHQLAQFLPWHREFLRIYESALQKECGYSGVSPYWDWTKDADAEVPMADSPLFDPLTGFGGDGVPGTYTLPVSVSKQDRIFPSFRGCVETGPFATYELSVGPGHQVTNHCLTRGINETMRRYLTTTAIAKLAASSDYDSFHIEMEGQPLTRGFRVHDAGHALMGGEMSSFYSSPGEPLFYLHHAQLDRLWWQWQNSAPGRMYEVNGAATRVKPVFNMTLDYIMDFSTLAPRTVVRDVMDILSERNCYTYE